MRKRKWEGSEIEKGGVGQIIQGEPLSCFHISSETSVPPKTQFP